MQEVLRSPGYPRCLYPAPHAGFRPRADSVPVADSNQLEGCNFCGRLKVDPAKLLVIFKSRFRQALHAELHAAGLHVEWKWIESDATHSRRPHGEANPFLIGISYRYRFDVIFIRLLAAEIEAEQIPYLHQPVVCPEFIRLAVRIESAAFLFLPGFVPLDELFGFRVQVAHVIAGWIFD